MPDLFGGSLPVPLAAQIKEVEREIVFWFFSHIRWVTP